MHLENTRPVYHRQVAKLSTDLPENRTHSSLRLLYSYKKKAYRNDAALAHVHPSGGERNLLRLSG